MALVELHGAGELRLPELGAGEAELGVAAPAGGRLAAAAEEERLALEAPRGATGGLGVGGEGVGDGDRRRRLGVVGGGERGERVLPVSATCAGHYRERREERERVCA